MELAGHGGITQVMRAATAGEAENLWRRDRYGHGAAHYAAPRLARLLEPEEETVADQAVAVAGLVDEECLDEWRRRICVLRWWAHRWDSDAKRLNAAIEKWRRES